MIPLINRETEVNKEAVRISISWTQGSTICRHRALKHVGSVLDTDPTLVLDQLALSINSYTSFLLPKFETIFSKIIIFVFVSLFALSMLMLK